MAFSANSFQISTRFEKEVFFIRTSGYIDNEAGEKILEAMNEGFGLGARKFLVNFQASPVINSQGVSAIFQLSEQIVDFRKGRLTFVGLSQTTMMVFRNTGLLEVAGSVTTEPEALKELA